MWKFLYKTTDAHKTQPKDVESFCTGQTGSKFYIYACFADGTKKTVARYNTQQEMQEAMAAITAAGFTATDK